MLANLVKRLSKRLADFKKNWHNRTPKQKWESIYNIPSNLLLLIGIRVLKDSKLFWYSYFCLVVLLIHISAVINTFWLFYKRGEVLAGLQCLSTVGIFVSNYSVYFETIGANRRKIRSVLNFTRVVYKNINGPSKYNDLCERMVNRLIKHMIFIVVVIVFSYTMFGVTSFYLITFKRKPMNFLGTELPFIDFNTKTGYIINTIQQFFLTSVGITANLGVELAACITYNSVQVVPLFFRLESEDLLDDLKSRGKSLSATLRMRNIFIEIQDFEVGVALAVDVYYTRLLLGPFFVVLSISSSIFIQMILGIPSGYGCAMCNYILLIIFCYLGENIQQVKEEMILELYSMPWYLLSPSCQKGIVTGILFIQNGPAFTIGPFAELNFETATDLTKSVYRFTMLLIKLFK